MTLPVLHEVKYLCRKGEYQPQAKYKSNMMLISMSTHWEESFQSKREGLSRRSKVTKQRTPRWQTSNWVRTLRVWVDQVRLRVAGEGLGDEM